MDSIDPQFLLYVVILAIVAISTLVKKAFEKAATKDQGRKIDLREAVREQLRRYMGEGQVPGGPVPGGPFTPPLAPPGPPRPPAPPARPAVAAPAPAPAASVPPPLPEEMPDAARAAERPLLTPIPPRPGHGRARPTSIQELRRAIVLAEILGPPLSEREDRHTV